MIIFYNLKTGEIEGTIDGRVHNEDHLKMWIGDKKEVGRIICEWKPTGKETITITEEPIYTEMIDDDGFTIEQQTGVKKKKFKNIEYEPEKQKEIYNEIEKKRNIGDFKVNIKDKTLERIK